MDVHFGVCLDRRQARRMTSTRFAVALRSAIKKKLPYTTVVRDLLCGGFGNGTLDEGFWGGHTRWDVCGGSSCFCMFIGILATRNEFSTATGVS